MKKLLTWLVIIVIVIVGVVWYVRGKGISTPANPSNPSNPTQTTSAGTTSPSTSVAVSETEKVSAKLLQYQNAELGFSLNYPNTWEKDEASAGVTFVMPIDTTQVSTVAKLQADVTVSAGKCAFPPVTTVKDRSTLTVGANTLNMISIANTVQGRGYFDRMYSLQHGDICYLFVFSSITQSPSSKNLTGSSLTQATNNNKAIVNASDAAFTDMVKSFSFVTAPVGQDETKVAPAKK